MSRNKNNGFEIKLHSLFKKKKEKRNAKRTKEHSTRKRQVEEESVAHVHNVL